MWNEQPSFDEVLSVLRERASVAAEIRVAELEIQIIEARIGKDFPRNPAARLLGTDEIPVLDIRRSLVQLRNRLDQLDAEIKFHDYRRDMFRSVSFRERA